jgi:hypothetical protein
VEFVEDHGTNARQFRVGLDHPRQYTLGHNLDPGSTRHLRFATHPVANRLTDGFAQGFRHPFGGSPCRKASGFEHDNTLGSYACVQHGQWNTRGLARTRRRLQNGTAPITQMGDKLW